MSKVQYLKVTQAEEGQKLLQFLQRRLHNNIPRSALMRWIRTGQVRLDKKRCKPFIRVGAAQQVRIPPYEAQEEQNTDTDQQASNPLCFVYEDRQLAVLNKPGGLAVQPGSKHTDSIHNRLAGYYSSASWRPTAVHRLDKDTSGLLLVAKSYAQLRQLHCLWRENKIDKFYLAWVQGRLDSPDWSRLEDKLEVTSNARGREKVEPSKRGKSALSWLKTISVRNNASLVALKLETGRKHQLRVQLSSRGHPILGDLKYGKTGYKRGLLLHSWHLSWEDHAFTLAPDWDEEFEVRL
jgi:23S rRNA pseudouridine955/2504/2580 synthase